MTKKNEINEMVFVSKTYGAQDFVAWSDENSVAVFGNMQMAKWSPKNAVQANKKDVASKIQQLKNRGYKIVDAYHDSYENVLEASKVIEK